eukprot:5163653-Alexandrium_andersonii.AAC.1
MVDAWDLEFRRGREHLSLPGSGRLGYLRHAADVMLHAVRLGFKLKGGPGGIEAVIKHSISLCAPK